MLEFFDKLRRQPWSWQIAVSIAVALLLILKFALYGATTIDLVLSYVGGASYMFRDWRVGKMTPDRWKAFGKCSVIWVCLILFTLR